MINGARREVDVPPNATLLAVLRDDLALTGTRYGCGRGQCGACFVIVDGRAVVARYDREGRLEPGLGERLERKAGAARDDPGEKAGHGAAALFLVTRSPRPRPRIPGST